MHVIDKTEDVKKQYANDKKLCVRIGLHAKHSTNREGFSNWLFKKYDFSGALRILELGCGNGAQWEGYLDRIPPDCLLVLTDLSDGMVGRVWGKFGSQRRVLSQTADIRNLPFPDECFDVVIANHMLYHVSNLPQAISEVRRVLKKAPEHFMRLQTETAGYGHFYAALSGRLTRSKTFFPKSFPSAFKTAQECSGHIFHTSAELIMKIPCALPSLKI